MSQWSLACKLYDEIGLGLLLLAWRFFWSANNFCAETVCMKASHHNFKTKQQAVEGDETCVCFASFGLRSLRIGLQRVSKPSTTTLKLTKATARPPDPRSSPISGNIMPIVIFGHMAPSSCVRTKLTRPVHSAHEDPNGERSKSAFVDLRHRRRNVCKWIVVRVEKQAARCRQIGSFPWWRWQTILKTARLWTPVTMPFLDGSS